MSTATMNIQVSFSGCLIENLNNLAENSHIYAPGWNSTYSSAIHTLKTSGGFPKLDFVAFTYHHVLTTLADRWAQNSMVTSCTCVQSHMHTGMPLPKRLGSTN